jgi:hypothetical protein
MARTARSRAFGVSSKAAAARTSAFVRAAFARARQTSRALPPRPSHRRFAVS